MKLLRRIDIDQLLIFVLLAVTINQMGYYLAGFAPHGWRWIGYAQAVAVDLAIWRSAWWFRKYRGKKQRRWALVGVVVFAAVSWWYNAGFYAMQNHSLTWWQPPLMGAVLPLGVALLSYLYGQKDESAYGHRESEGKERESKQPPIPFDGLYINDRRIDFAICETCGRIFSYPSEHGGEYANQRAAQNAMNAHKCKGELK